MIAASCVLFVHMGLSEAVQEHLRIRLRFLSCPKCMTFWCVLAWSLLTGHDAVRAVAVSFLFAYAALWAALLLDGLAVIYNLLYEQITETEDTTQAPEGAGGPAGPEAGGDEVPQMQ